MKIRLVTQSPASLARAAGSRAAVTPPMTDDRRVTAYTRQNGTGAQPFHAGSFTLRQWRRFNKQANRAQSNGQ